MAWIESHQVLAQHPKVLQLAKACGWSIDETIGKLHRFWWWCLDYAIDGRLSKFDHGTIESVFGVGDGDGHVVQTLIKLKWLDFEPEIRVHDWWDYAGRFLQVRYKRTPKIWKEIKRFYGHSIQRTNNRTTTNKQPTNNHKPNLTRPNLTRPNLTRPNQTKEEEKKKKDYGEVKKDCAEGALVAPPKSAATWQRYAAAYHERYGVDPVRNRRTNALLCQLVDRLGVDEAPSTAEFYLSHNSPLYVRARHPPDLLVRDAESLRTQWVSGVCATSGEAQNLEQRENRIGQLSRVLAKLEGGQP